MINGLQGRPSVYLSLIKLTELICQGIDQAVSNLGSLAYEAYTQLAVSVSSMISLVHRYLKKADEKLKKLGTDYDLVIQTPTQPRSMGKIPARYAPLLGDWVSIQFGGLPGRIAGLTLSNKKTRNPRHEIVIIRFDYHPFPTKRIQLMLNSAEKPEFLNTRAVRVCEKVMSVSFQMHEEPYIYGFLRKTRHEMDFS